MFPSFNPRFLVETRSLEEQIADAAQEVADREVDVQDAKNDLANAKIALQMLLREQTSRLGEEKL